MAELVSNNYKHNIIWSRIVVAQSVTTATSCFPPLCICLLMRQVTWSPSPGIEVVRSRKLFMWKNKFHGGRTLAHPTPTWTAIILYMYMLNRHQQSDWVPISSKHAVKLVPCDTTISLTSISHTCQLKNHHATSTWLGQSMQQAIICGTCGKHHAAHHECSSGMIQSPSDHPRPLWNHSGWCLYSLVPRLILGQRISWADWAHDDTTCHYALAQTASNAMCKQN